MSKPANFPERKRQRQLRAYARLPKNPRVNKEPAPSGYRQEIYALIPKTSQRDVRTKKTRTSNAQFFRR